MADTKFLSGYNGSAFYAQRAERDSNGLILTAKYIRNDDNNLIIGYNNTVGNVSNGNYFIVGFDNKIGDTQYNTIIGNHCSAGLTGGYCQVQGHTCLSDRSSLTQGFQCSASDYSLSQGSDCYANLNSIAQGNDCSAYNNAQAFGFKTNIDGGMAIGKLNLTTANAAFVIGNGTINTFTQEQNRSDLFVINNTGVASGKDFIDENENKLSECINKNQVKVYKEDQHYSTTHTITQTDLSTGYFYMSFPLYKTQIASNVRLMGDIFGFRGIRTNGYNIDSSHISSLEISLGSDGSTITNEPTIRKIDASEFVNSDRNVSDSSRTTQSIFHFSHFGSCSTNMQTINTSANSLLIKVNFANNTSVLENDKFEIFVGFIQF